MECSAIDNVILWKHLKGNLAYYQIKLFVTYWLAAVKMFISIILAQKNLPELVYKQEIEHFETEVYMTVCFLIGIFKNIL